MLVSKGGDEKIFELKMNPREYRMLENLQNSINTECIKYSKSEVIKMAITAYTNYIYDTFPEKRALLYPKNEFGDVEIVKSTGSLGD